MPEGEQRRRRRVDVVAQDHASSTAVVRAGVHPDLAYGVQEGDREPAAGVHLAAKDVGQGVATLFTGQPGQDEALACGTTSSSEWARPPITTTTTGTPRADVSAMRVSCSAGSRKSAASRNSPEVSARVRPLRPPTNTTATSAVSTSSTISTRSRSACSGVGVGFWGGSAELAPHRR